MDNAQDILDVIYQTHTRGKESRFLMGEILKVTDKDDVWEKIEELLEFFNLHVVQHFAAEEVLMAVMRRDLRLLPAEEQAFREIAEEHKIMLAKLERLNAIAGGMHSHETREEFVEIAGDIFEMLPKHGGREDETLYALARRELKPSQMEEIAGAIRELQAKEKGGAGR